MSGWSSSNVRDLNGWAYRLRRAPTFFLVAVNAAAPEVDHLANGARRSVHQIARGDHAAFESRVLRVVEGVVTQLESLRADEVLSVEQRSRVACKSIT